MADELAALQDTTFARARATTTAAFGPSTRLSGDELARYLDRRAFGVISTARPDGRPHAAMTSYTRRDDVFWLPTVADSVREANVALQPWVSLVIAEGDHDEHVVVVIEGTGELVAPSDTPEDVRAFAGDWATVWIRLRARRILSYGAERAHR